MMKEFPQLQSHRWNVRLSPEKDLSCEVYEQSGRIKLRP